MVDARSREELECELKAAEADLEEVEEMRGAVLGQTGVQIGANELKRYNSRFDGDQQRLEQRIAEIRALLTAMDSGSVV